MFIDKYKLTKYSFKQSAKSIIKTDQNYYSENEVEEYPTEVFVVSDSKLNNKNKSEYTNGTIIYNETKEVFELVNLSDGKFCINGTLSNLVLTEESC